MLSALRDAAKKDPTFQEAAMDSLSHVKSLLVQLLGRLQARRLHHFFLHLKLISMLSRMKFNM